MDETPFWIKHRRLNKTHSSGLKKKQNKTAVIRSLLFLLYFTQWNSRTFPRADLRSPVESAQTLCPDDTLEGPYLHQRTLD